MLFSCTVVASTPEVVTERNDFPQYQAIQAFTYRAASPFLSVTEQDLALIKEFIRINHDLSGTDYTQVRGTGYLFVAITKALEQDKLPLELLDEIRKLAVAVSQYSEPELMNTIGHVFIQDMNYLMWLIELRKIRDLDALVNYLKLSIKTGSENQHVLHVLIQKNLHHEASVWFDGETVKRLGLLNTWLKKRALFEQELVNSDPPQQLLIDEYTQLIRQVFDQYESSSQTERTLLVQQVDWLLRLLNARKSDPEIREMLQQLSDDWLIFNPRVIDGLSGTGSEQLYRLMFSEFDVMWKASQILTDELSHQSSPDFAHQIKKKQHITDKIQLMRGDDR